MVTLDKSWSTTEDIGLHKYSTEDIGLHEDSPGLHELVSTYFCDIQQLQQLLTFCIQD